MRAVETYDELCESLRILDCEQKVFPIILIKPQTLLHFQGELQDLFEYFHIRSGKGIFFYLPGYTHYPLSSISTIFVPSYSNRQEKIALKIDDVGTIHYSMRAFISFVKKMETLIPEFQYLGDTELMLAEYNKELNQLSFENVKRINLSRVFLKRQDKYMGLHEVEKLLERILHKLNEGCSMEKLVESIDIYTEIDNYY